MGQGSASFTIGQIVSHYCIKAKIGEGGMGVVYKALDTRLDRFVAIKVLSTATAANPERKLRFAQEAKAASALNHPNILHVYEIDTRDAVDFIAMEYVEGQTLEDLIRHKGLPIGEGLQYAVQIADGLASAHAEGIVHRDIKPGNIMVNEKGLVKILDFGLAKLSEPGQEKVFDTTQTIRPQTEEGAIVGTVCYMSPEQAEGKKVDPRSDIFSFGSVLYEMVTGQRAFQNASKLSTLSAILHQQPKPLEELAAGVPYDLPRLVSQCMRKDPARRFQHMEDVKILLEQLREDVNSCVAAAPRDPVTASPIPRLAKWIMLGGVILALFAWYVVSPGSREVALKATFTQLTDQPGPELYASLSPDGKSFAYQGRASGKWDIYLQRVGGKNAINLTKDSIDDDTQPAFSPDGERIAFRSERDGGGIFLIEATGENVKRVTSFGYNPSWSPDGKEIVCSTGWFLRPEDTGMSTFGQLFRVNVATGERRAITPKTGTPKQPHWSPHGYRVAFWQTQKGQRDIWTVADGGGDPVAVTNDPHVDWNPVWSPDGRYLYFSSDRGGSMNLWRVRIDETSGKTLAAPQAVTTPSASSGFISFSRDGRHLAYVQQFRNWNVYKVGFDPDREATVGQPVPVTRGSKELAFPDVSPDGQWIAFTSRLKPEDLFIAKADGTRIRQLTDDIYEDRVPRWSPNGKRIAFMSNRSGDFQIWTIKPDGSDLKRLTDLLGGAIAPTWSPDGMRLLCLHPGHTPFMIRADIPWKDQSAEELPLSESGAIFTPWSWSADGRKLGGYLQREDGSSEGIALYSLQSRRYERLASLGDWPQWLPDSRRLIFHHQGKAYLIDSQSKKMHEVLSVAPHAVSWQFGLSRDGRLMVFTLDATEADVWMMNLQ